MANLGCDFDWATVTEILRLLRIIIFIYQTPSHTKLDVKYKQLHMYHSMAHTKTSNA